MKIKKGDKVLLIAGKDRGKEGKVLDVIVQSDRIVVEGLNIGKKHTKPRQQGEKGQTIEFPRPLHVSNAKVICPKCGKASRLGAKLAKGKDNKQEKFRVCKKCGSEI